MRIKTLLCLLLLVGGTHVVAAQDALRSDPGYVDLQAIEQWFDREAKLEVNVKGALLELVAEASRDSNPDLADMLSRLKAVQVRGFELEEERFTSIQDQVSALARTLEDNGWETIVRVREDDEHVNMYLKTNEGIISGLMVMVNDLSSEETIFVNIVGDIDPKQIGRLGRAFDIDPLEDIRVD